MATGLALHGLLDALQPNLLFTPILSLVFILSLLSLHSYLLLRGIPGPLLAAFSNLPRVSWVLSGRAHDIHIHLHRQYGKLVRFGPNMVSVGDPAEIQTLYSFTGKFTKVKSSNGAESDTPDGPNGLSD